MTAAMVADTSSEEAAQAAWVADMAEKE